MMDEAGLVRRAMLGDTAALEELIGLYYGPVYAFCCRRMGSTGLGADITQDTFVKMVESLPRYKEQGRFKSWLFTIAANLCRDAFRKKRPATGFSDILDAAADGEPCTMWDSVPGQPHKARPGAPTGPAFQLQAENGALLKAALDKLPDAQKEAIILRYYHDFALPDIARITKTALPTVKTRLFRGLRRLRDILGEEVLLED